MAAILGALGNGRIKTPFAEHSPLPSGNQAGCNTEAGEPTRVQITQRAESPGRITWTVALENGGCDGVAVGVALMETVFKAAAAYFVLMLMMRVTGRRTGKRTTTFEILLIFLLGGQMTQAILADDRSFTNAFLGVSIVALCHTFVAWWKTKSERVAHVIDATPLIIYADGEWQQDCMRMVRVQMEDVLQHAREEGIDKLEKIRYVMWKAMAHCRSSGTTKAHSAATTSSDTGGSFRLPSAISSVCCPGGRSFGR